MASRAPAVSELKLTFRSRTALFMQFRAAAQSRFGGAGAAMRSRRCAGGTSPCAVPPGDGDGDGALMQCAARPYVARTSCRFNDYGDDAALLRSDLDSSTDVDRSPPHW